MTNDTLSTLARNVQSKFAKPQIYGRLRSKLTKQGFSEIAIMKAVSDHCDENFIDPIKMVDETIELMEGLARNINFLATSNVLPSLRGQFHQLRHGNTNLDEPKSAEQKNKFLCNMCHCIKGKDERSKSKSYKNTCSVCVAQKVKSTLSAQTPAPKQEPVSAPITEDKPMYEAPKETPVIAPIVPETNGSTIRITEVMADVENATVSITCSPKELHIVLGALSNITA